MNDESLDIIETSDGLLADVQSMIEQTRAGVAQTVNVGMTSLHWRIGKQIQSEILKGQRADYGKEIVSTLWRQLNWSHFKSLIYLDNPFKTEFYAEMCRVERWSVRTLRDKMRRLIVIDLKLGDFKAEYKGQMDLYLRWLAKYEQQAGGESPLGLILCAGKKEEIRSELEQASDTAL